MGVRLMGCKLGEDGRKSDFGEQGEISQVQWRTTFPDFVLVPSLCRLRPSLA
jgi:hypothetical protein